MEKYITENAMSIGSAVRNRGGGGHEVTLTLMATKFLMMRTALKTMENNRSHMIYVIKLPRDMLYTRIIHNCISWACSIIHWRVLEKK